MKKQRDFSPTTWFVILIILVLLIFGVTHFSLQSIFRGFETFDAVWSSQAAVRGYVYDNEGSWPKNWDDLKPIFARNNIDQDHVSRIRKIVDIDFQFDPKCKLEDFSAISMHDGTTNGELENANQRLRDTLRKSMLHKLDNEIPRKSNQP